ncbi:MAG: DUF2845 domain-containing protein [Xanthomonadales bacterium]|nr:DUF2845 domain-containing protein [Xanthomonadales bacterium]
MRHRSGAHAELTSTVVVLGLVFAQSLAADSLRCGRKVVRSGDSPATLIAACGEPLYRGKAEVAIETGSGKRNVRADSWHYKLSERSLERIVLIYRGEIVAVETGGR